MCALTKYFEASRGVCVKQSVAEIDRVCFRRTRQLGRQAGGQTFLAHSSQQRRRAQSTTSLRRFATRVLGQTLPGELRDKLVCILQSPAACRRLVDGYCVLLRPRPRPRATAYHMRAAACFRPRRLQSPQLSSSSIHMRSNFLFALLDWWPCRRRIAYRGQYSGLFRQRTKRRRREEPQ